MNGIDLPPTIGALLAWIASGTGIGVILVWLANLPIWTMIFGTGDLAKWLPPVKAIVLSVVGLALGIGAMKATSYLPAGVPPEWDEYYKLLLTIVNIVISISASNVVRFTFMARRQRIDLDIEEKRARLHDRTTDALIGNVVSAHG